MTLRIRVVRHDHRADVAVGARRAHDHRFGALAVDKWISGCVRHNRRLLLTKSDSGKYGFWMLAGVRIR
ncbi:unnamed protein product [Sphagnum balticum]